MDKEKEIQTIATFVHGALASLHLLGVVYNLKRGNKTDTLVHTLGLCYDLNRAYKHYKAVKEA